MVCNTNRRIDGEGVIKVADFGLTEDMYNTNCIRREAEDKVPVRWMAPESIEHSIYTEATDVVSNCTVHTHVMVYMPTFHAVVIWSDNVGDIHLWEGAVCWNTCHAPSE